MRKLFKLLILILIIIYLVIGVYLYFFQKDFIYYPTEKIKHSYDVKTFYIDNEKIDLIVLNPDKEKAILYLGGRSESVIQTADIFKNIFSEFTIYLLNYRGYGSSSGEPSQEALYKDARVVYDFIQSYHKNISIIGRSLGTGIATYLSSMKEPDKLVLVTPYDSILHMAQDKYPIYPIKYLLKEKFNSDEYSRNIKNVPTLIFLVDGDLIVPYKYSISLINAFDSKQVNVYMVNNTTHKDVINTLEYQEKLKKFLEENF